MNVNDLNITYSSGNIETSYNYPNSFGITFVLACFLGTLTVNDTANTCELGNIETFLSNDPYYPQHSIGIRYSSLYNEKYIRRDTNCARCPINSAFTIENDLGSPWIAFLTDSGIVRGPKNGSVANYSSIKYSHQYVVDLMQKIRSSWDANNISAGTVNALVPDVLMHKTECVDDQLVISENRTIYDNLGPDPRNPLDPTRNKGIYPKCSSKNCFGNQFVSKFNDQTYRIHDEIFRANLNIQLAEAVLKYQC